MIIILEGVDKAGKSTLAKELRTQLKWPVIHFGKPGPDPATEYFDFLNHINENIICDRFFVGELVYGPLLRGKNSMTSLQIRVIERMCRKIGTLLIHVSPPYSVINDRLIELGDEMVTHAQNQKAYDMFKTIIDGIKTGPKMALLWANYSPHKIAEQIVKFIKPQLPTYNTVRSFSGIGTVIGTKVVLVGDKINKNTTWVNKPFDGGPASKYLLRTMLCSKLNEEEVYITNADVLDSDEVEFLKSTGETQFVALGNIASDRLNFLNVKHRKIDHPQYRNRFKFDDINEYVKDLEIAVKGAPIYNVDFNRI